MGPAFYRAIVTEVQVKARSVEGREKEMETRDRGADGTRIDEVTDPFIPPDLRARDVKRQKERIRWVGCGRRSTGKVVKDIRGAQVNSLKLSPDMVNVRS